MEAGNVKFPERIKKTQTPHGQSEVNIPKLTTMNEKGLSKKDMFMDFAFIDFWFTNSNLGVLGQL